ncbi:MAG: hypothetical protein LBS69_10030 [Prevotellaceae bacterium]|jgi:hypothetical protein|nr:hypothetical protein [Prevotellaceae bacterium]
MIYQIDKHSPQIYTTGAFLRPLKIIDAGGKELWVWAVEGFEGGESFKDGRIVTLKDTISGITKIIDKC